MLAVRRASTERSVQTKRKKEEAENEIKKLSDSLEMVDEKINVLALGMKAEFLKAMKLNKQLLVERERRYARYVSDLSSAATDAQKVGKLQREVESQHLQIAQMAEKEKAREATRKQV